MTFMERVFRIISRMMNVPLEDIHEGSSPENLEKWDSFQHINLILALEEEFEVKFTEEEIFQMDSAGNILGALQSKGVKA